MEKFHNVVTLLIRISAATLDYGNLFLCPLFEIIFDKAGLRFLFDESEPDGMKESEKDKWE